jgi:L-rhamnose mutarotase
LANNPIVQKWWAYMADLMDVNEDDSPISTELEEVFYLP